MKLKRIKDWQLGDIKALAPKLAESIEDRVIYRYDALGARSEDITDEMWKVVHEVEASDDLWKVVAIIDSDYLMCDDDVLHMTAYVIIQCDPNSPYVPHKYPVDCFPNSLNVLARVDGFGTDWGTIGIAEVDGKLLRTF